MLGQSSSHPYADDGRIARRGNGCAMGEDRDAVVFEKFVDGAARSELANDILKQDVGHIRRTITVSYIMNVLEAGSVNI